MPEVSQRVISMYVGVLAAGLAICSLGGNDAEQEAMLASIEAANGWAFFQAKNLKREVVSLRSDDEAVATLTKTLDDLYVRGKQLEARRDQALARDPWFDRGSALLQIAIVLASVAAVVGGWSLLVGSGVAAFAGLASTVLGFLGVAL